jgi:hypothetical protein
MPNDRKILQMTIKYSSIFHSKTLQNLPNLGFLVWKQTIWQPRIQVLCRIPEKKNMYLFTFVLITILACLRETFKVFTEYSALIMNRTFSLELWRSGQRICSRNRHPRFESRMICVFICIWVYVYICTWELKTLAKEKYTIKNEFLSYIFWRIF